VSGLSRCSVPHWRDVAAVIPEDYQFDGASSPFRIIYPLIYWSRTTRTAITIAARVHDYGYGPARLHGAPVVAADRSLVPLALLDREEWDGLYRSALVAMGHPRIAALHYWALRKVGGHAWRKNAQKMQRKGIKTYADWLTARR